MQLNTQTQPLSANNALLALFEGEYDTFRSVGSQILADLAANTVKKPKQIRRPRISVKVH